MPTQTTFAPSDKNGFLSIEDELQKRREQQESVKGKETPFRVVFRFKGGSSHYQYFETYEATLTAEDSICRYSPWGHAIIERPTSRQIQIRGPRGGWKKYIKTN